MVRLSIGISNDASSSFGPPTCCARQLGLSQRRDLSLQALRRTEPVARLAAHHEVSRKFVYQQMERATTAIDQAFTPPASESDQILFWLPVTKDWLEQLVLSLTLTCHSPFRGVLELLETMFDYHEISVGTISNLLQWAVSKARPLNDAEDLSALRVGAHDEIYQASQPVLVGMDVISTYCYLLEAVDHCDETTWGVHLLELRGRRATVGLYHCGCWPSPAGRSESRVARSALPRRHLSCRKELDGIVLVSGESCPCLHSSSPEDRTQVRADRAVL